jgi:hypothetical protein
MVETMVVWKVAKKVENLVDSKVEKMVDHLAE